jgi:hypothetical protein
MKLSELRQGIPTIFKRSFGVLESVKEGDQRGNRLL